MEHFGGLGSGQLTSPMTRNDNSIGFWKPTCAVDVKFILQSTTVRWSKCTLVPCWSEACP